MRIAKAAPPIHSEENSDNDGPGDGEGAPTIKFVPFFVTRSEVGRSRSMSHFLIIICCIVVPLGIGIGFLDDITVDGKGLDITFLVLEIVCLLFIYLGLRLFYRFCKGVQSVEIGYDPENDTRVIIRHRQCWYFQGSCSWCCCCLDRCCTKDSYRAIHESHKLTKVIKARMKEESEGSDRNLYIVELRTHSRNWQCRIDQFRAKDDATRLMNNINTHLDKNKQFKCESMVDYA